MSKEPSFKVIVPVAALYVLILFAPTIDGPAIHEFSLFSLILPIGIASFIFPGIYPISDSITEVYGKRVAYFFVSSCYIVTVLFSLLNNWILSTADNYSLYQFMTHTSLTVTIIGPITYILTSFINIKLLSKLKILMRGRHFVIRSLICSSISDALMSLILMPLVFQAQPMNFIVKITVGTIVVKVLLTVPMVFLAKGLVHLYRYTDGVEVEEYNEGLVRSGFVS